jgi:hypothetical protein
MLEKFVVKTFATLKKHLSQNIQISISGAKYETVRLYIYDVNKYLSAINSHHSDQEMH